MARRKKHEEHENHERWLVSYADFITLLFAFFVVMYSISSINEGKYRVLSNSLVTAFGQPASSIAQVKVGEPYKAPIINPMQHRGDPIAIEIASPITQESDAKEKDQAMTQVVKELQSNLKDLIDKDIINIERNGNMVEVEINTSILFVSGSSHLQPEAVSPLRKISKILSGTKHHIQVEGFTDNVPISTVAFPSNWELSAARSASVVHLFMKNGVSPERMAAVGVGEYRPIDSNTSEVGRRRNRRVVVVITPESKTRSRNEPEMILEHVGNS